MLSSTTRVTNTAHILLPTSPGNGYANGVEATCHVQTSEHTRKGVTLTLVYIDLPRTSSCSQHLWANDKDGIKLFSLCSPTWQRQRTVFEGHVEQITLHFTSQPDVLPAQRTIQNKFQTAPSLFIWIYLQGVWAGILRQLY